MRPLLVCGNANVETVLHVPAGGPSVEGGFFPHAMHLNVSGVGINLARALHTLGSPVRLLTLAAPDTAGQVIRAALSGIETHVAPTSATPQSLALVLPDGTHTFYRDLKDTPGQAAPTAELRTALEGCAAALMTNIGWTRELLPLARQAAVPILTDVQDIAGVDQPYDQPYFRAADLLLFSAARLGEPRQTLLELQARSPARLIVAALGADGALMLERGSDRIHHQAAFPVRVVSQGGAGDALAGALAHFYFSCGEPPQAALRLACAAAALKLGAAGSGVGQATEEETRRFAARFG